MRKSVEETWRQLESEGWEMPRGPDGLPFVPPAAPNQDDEELGFSFFRTLSEDADLSGLSLPRTYFCRSEIATTSFARTDLSESRMCWNDFDECDFSGADLDGCDLRASNHVRCSFVGASLRGADLRRANFEDCDFTAADLAGATGEDSDDPLRDHLADWQQEVMTWADDPGPEPPGG